MTASIQVHSTRQNRTVHKATLDEPTLLKLARRAVAEHAGVNLDMETEGATVEVRAYVSSYQEGSLGTRKACVEVELIVHHTGRAEPERE
ncbi:hypothetical protein [Acidovorax sp. NCPPB 4044]|uniref:hypothetical protein n=1 Tax=Acidovorax sp. NCPPB 4044 TaxID=2940490 RepID=UPI002304A564|nr:hypothetical protein [Acidovorax sp. NCPPB 4044]MDA8521991.1 hypothetical protein [Acidovorax sp. NCPPB 4044]